MNHAPAPVAYELWSLVILNSLVFNIFAFSFAKPQSRRDWRSFGAFSAFLVALFTEMYGPCGRATDAFQPLRYALRPGSVPHSGENCWVYERKHRLRRTYSLHFKKYWLEYIFALLHANSRVQPVLQSRLLLAGWLLCLHCHTGMPMATCPPSEVIARFGV